MKNKQIYNILLLILIFSCQNEKDDNYKLDSNYILHPSTKYIFYDDYPSFYQFYYQYEYEENTRLLDSKKFYEIMKRDSNLLIKLYRVNYVLSDNRDISTIQVLQTPIIGYSLIFYKYQSYYNLDTSAWLVNYEYPVDTTLRKKRKIFELHYEYPNPNPDTSYKSCYIEWSSKQANIFEMNHNLPGGKPEYMWGINKTTDTIHTNLSHESIMSLYPDFNGVYIFKKYSKIEVDYSYQIKDSSFFNHIKFIE